MERSQNFNEVFVKTTKIPDKLKNKPYSNIKINLRETHEYLFILGLSSITPAKIHDHVSGDLS